MTVPRARTIRRTVIAVVAVAALVVATGVLLRQIRPDDTETVEAAPTLRVEVAERADLSDVVTLDGTVEDSATLTVVHRIEGATPSSNTTGQRTTATAASTGDIAGPSAGTQGGPQGFSNGPSATIDASTYLRTVPSEPTPETTATTTEPSTTTEPATTTTTVPDEPAPTTTSPPPPPTDSCETTTTTSADEPVPSSQATSTTSPASTDCPDTTTPSEPPATTAPGATPGGGRPSGFPGGGAPAGTSGGGASGGAGTSPTGSTSSLTERVTSLPQLGSTIELGDVLYSVDGRPVVAMTGALPQWRALDSSSDDGVDIVQLETSLLALGYDDDGALVVDAAWDNATTRAVGAWQRGLGLEPTGEIALGDIVFLPETPVTVTAVHTAVGDDVTEQDAIVDVSGATQRVVAAVTDDVVSVVTVGLPVQLAGDEPTEATITLMRSVTADDGTIGTELIVSPNSGHTQQAAGSSIDVLVNVRATTTGEVTVPAAALASRLDGSYAVQVRDTAGDHWVAVDVLEIQGSRVAVSGIDEGTQVLVAA